MRVCAILLLVFLYFRNYSQFGAFQYRSNFKYALVLPHKGDDKIRVAAHVGGLSKGPGTIIFTYSDSLTLEDSTYLLNGTISMNSLPLGIPGSMVLPCVAYDTLSGSQSVTLAIMKLDSNFKLLFFSSLLQSTMPFLNPVSVVRIGDYFYAGFDIDQSQSILIKTDTTLAFVDSLFLQGGLNSLEVFRGNLLLTLSSPACMGGSNLKIRVLDTSLVSLTCMEIDSVAPQSLPTLPDCGLFGMPKAGGFFLPLTDHEVMGFGFSYIPSASLPIQARMVNVIMDSVLTLEKVNLINCSMPESQYVGYSSHAIRHGSLVVSVGLTGVDVNDPTQVNKLVVVAADLNGNIKWTREFGGDMFYRPVAINYTKDGGYVIAGMRYDSTRMTWNIKLHLESFLLKLSASGDVNLVNIPILRADKKLDVAPNPATSTIRIGDISGCQCEVEVFDLFGKLITSGIFVNVPAIFDLTNYPKGYYIFRHSSNLGVFFGKFIRE